MKIDAWLASLSYEEICQWQNICEYLHECIYHRVSSASILRACGGQVRNLIHYDRVRREVLWQQYKIQLIIWEVDVWQLKGNWEDKICFLEQVYILGRNPQSLRRVWLEKWEKKQALEAIAAQKQAVQAYYRVAR